MIPNEPDFLNYLKIEDMELVGKYGFPKVKGISPAYLTYMQSTS